MTGKNESVHRETVAAIAAIVSLIFMTSCDNETEAATVEYQYFCETDTSCPAGMVNVPKGEFIMGSNDAMAWFPEAISPRHNVYLSAYCIDVNEVTNSAYAECVSAGQCETPDAVAMTHGNYFEDTEFANYSVIGISWEMADAYCQWKGKRLPTDAEWEKAARGPAPFEWLYPWGPVSEEYNSDEFPVTTCPLYREVGSYPKGRSPYCINDMVGGAPEYVSDYYDKNYYSVSPRRNPQGPESGTVHTVRGISCCPCSCNFGVPNAFMLLQRLECSGESLQIGFRCAADISPAP